jgi:hypothetical protein
MALLPIEKISKIIATTRETYLKQRNGFYEVANIRKYVAYMWLMQNAKSLPDQNNTFSWNIRPAATGATTGTYTPYQAMAYTQSPNGTKMSVNRRAKSAFLNNWYDATTLGDSPNNIINQVEQDTSTAVEDMAADWESTVFQTPYNLDDPNAFLGAKYWFGYSQNSSGTYVAQADPARNGVYTTLGDGTITGTVGALDRTLTKNANARTILGTYDGTISESLLNGIRKAGRLAGITYLAGLKGEKPSSGMIDIFMTEDQELAYTNLLSSLGGTRKNDFFNTGDSQIASMNVIATPSMASISRGSIFGLDPMNFFLAKVPGFWDMEGEQRQGPWTVARPRIYHGQILCKQPGVAGFHFHTSF